MSTKHIARSAFEGGKPVPVRDQGRNYTRAERRHAREALGEVVTQVTSPEDVVVERRQVPWREVTDQLNPVRRFLRSRAGHPWDDVWSELCRRFDRRSLGGFHILDQHVRRHLVDGPWIGERASYTGERRAGSYVDLQGILRFAQKRRR